MSEPASGTRDADHQRDRNDDNHREHREPGATEHALRILGRASRILCGSKQRATRRRLQLLMRSGDERRAFIEKLKS